MNIIIKNIFFRNDSRFKGEFTELEPYESYKFHICIENFQTPHYFSEKITNTLLCGTTPVYLGCHNIEQYFQENVICLSGNVETDIILIRGICENPDKYVKQFDVEDIKKIVSIENVILKDF